MRGIAAARTKQRLKRCASAHAFVLYASLVEKGLQEDVVHGGAGHAPAMERAYAKGHAPMLRVRLLPNRTKTSSRLSINVNQECANGPNMHPAAVRMCARTLASWPCCAPPQNIIRSARLPSYPVVMVPSMCCVQRSTEDM